MVADAALAESHNQPRNLQTSKCRHRRADEGTPQADRAGSAFASGHRESKAGARAAAAQRESVSTVVLNCPYSGSECYGLWALTAQSRNEDCAHGSRKAIPGTIHCQNPLPREHVLTQRAEWGVFSAQVHRNLCWTTCPLQDDICLWSCDDPGFSGKVQQVG